MEKKKKRYGAMNKVGNEPTLLAQRANGRFGIKSRVIDWWRWLYSRIHRAVSTPEGSFLRVGVIKSQSNRGEKAAGLKKEPNVAIFPPGVTALCLETRLVARSWKETASLFFSIKTE